ncbi:MAG: MmcQ/YjbR family DNA-binding protein [Bacteroidia bacterium]
MVKHETFTKLALSFAETSAGQHHEVISFKVKGKIFATLNPPFQRACVRLNPVDQDVFCAYDPEVMYRVPNAWGKYGWTNINLKKIRKEMLVDAIRSAYCTVAPAKLAANYRLEPED